LSTKLRVLFTGYAPVHFLCFRPLYERLHEIPGVEIRVSGGLRERTGEGYRYDESALFGPLGVPACEVLPLDEMRESSADLLFAANTKLIEPAQAKKKVQIFHGVSFRNKAVRSANLSADHYFIAGPYMRRRFADAGLMPPGDPRGLEIGFMKTDRLVDGTLDRASLLAQHGLDGSRPVVVYAPTGQRGNSLETMGIDAIARIARTNAFDLIVKTHDHPKQPDAACYRALPGLAGDRVRISRELDVIPLLYLADVLITDASSVSSEYALLDRPMLFLDVPELLARAAGAGESQLDLDTWGRRAGAVVKTAQGVVPALEAALSNPQAQSQVRRAMAADLFFNPGRATAAALAWIRRELGIA